MFYTIKRINLSSDEKTTDKKIRILKFDGRTEMKSFFLAEIRSRLPVNDPCDDLWNCHSLVNGNKLAPSRNNLVAIVPAALYYKISADVFCDHSMAFSPHHLNIIHVSAGNNLGSAGDRTFGMWKYPSENKILLAVNDPKGVFGDHVNYWSVDCTDGEWNTYSVEVKQSINSPEDLRFIVSVDGTTINQGTYNYRGAKTTGHLKVFVSNDWHDAASLFFVRNFYYQTLSDKRADKCA